MAAVSKLQHLTRLCQLALGSIYLSLTKAVGTALFVTV
jgi:hypothetical protein